MNKEDADRLALLASSDDSADLFQVVREATEHFDVERTIDPILHQARVQAILGLRENYTIPEIANETGMKVGRIWDIFKIRKQREARHNGV